MLSVMTKSKMTPDILAHMHRIHTAVNDGTVNKDAINEALAALHDLLSADEDPTSEISPEPEPAPAKPSRKKR